MITEDIWSHFGSWWAVALWIVLYGVFLLFMPFYKKSQRKPSTAYMAFVVAYALEMFGIPMSMFIIGWAFGITLPEGVLWGHTLGQWIGYWGMYLGIATSLLGGMLIFFGWRRIYKEYWSRNEGTGKIVTGGIYRYIRHPQYTGFMLVTLGMMMEWATLPLLIMWPILGVIYYRLALREEKDMLAEFGEAYAQYRQQTGMFLPRWGKAKA
ncbi:isoprenylcysteine carboxyl methyltransferase [Ornatilinea apprima]|uniref:Isoprenylcysteine carboxyl methyltransferase n=1 Tax=Ornatilinea apprima TaxID=1134406 RepID=A0A0N8GNL3_9CHLR|nr:isoprenylcysteine carboxylmethyltransferase family protein [Ornatilinea apprima]KPL78418.1 isoprenylcysteine carboxyl methyltransferase [Ornatilinea apprima]